MRELPEEYRMLAIGEARKQQIDASKYNPNLDIFKMFVWSKSLQGTKFWSDVDGWLDGFEDELPPIPPPPHFPGKIKDAKCSPQVLTEDEIREMREPLPQGMTLRDWFAGQAMQGVMDVYNYRKMQHIKPEDVADAAYRQADAMLKAREKK